MSQSQLATAIGVTPSTISQVENNTITLSLPALVRLVKVLDISMDSLFSESATLPATHFLFRAKNRTKGVVKLKQGASLDALMPDAPPHALNAYIVHITPEMDIPGHFFSRKGREFGYLLSGSLEFEMKGRTYTLTAGDAVYFTSDIPTAWRNTSEKEAHMLITVIP